MQKAWFLAACCLILAACAVAADKTTPKTNPAKYDGPNEIFSTGSSKTNSCTIWHQSSGGVLLSGTEARGNELWIEQIQLDSSGKLLSRTGLIKPLEDYTGQVKDLKDPPELFKKNCVGWIRHQSQYQIPKEHLAAVKIYLGL